MKFHVNYWKAVRALHVGTWQSSCGPITLQKAHGSVSNWAFSLLVLKEIVRNVCTGTDKQ